MATLGQDVTADEPQEKKLWGTPLKLKEANERIVQLEAQIARMGGGASYDLEVWNEHPPIDPATGKGIPHRWHHWHANEWEWLYHDEQTHFSDNGYGDFDLERLPAMLKAAFIGKGGARMEERLGSMNKGHQTFDKFPKFSKDNKLVVIVKVVRVDPRTETV